MNRQPYCRPPRWWEPKLNPWIVRRTRGHRRRQLAKQQRIQRVDVSGWERISRHWRAGDGVLIVPNHSAHYDSTALYIAGDQHDMPLHFMTAWQVFGMSRWWQQWLLQRLGCFSIDREADDRQAFKQAIELLRSGQYPLVIFPEGDIYHTTEYVTPFREGAAAIALSAAKRAERRIWAVPCGIRFWYEDDPLPEIERAITAMELSLHLRIADSMTIAERIHRLAEAALALKELDYTEHTREGSVRRRIEQLTETVLSGCERRHGFAANDDGGAGPTTAQRVPERVKLLRKHVIQQLETADESSRQLERDMEDLFFVMQLYSYRGDYLDHYPSVERIAETVDKLEEDVLQLALPNVRGRRRVQIQVGEPRHIQSVRGRDAVSELTHWMQSCVQELVDNMSR